MPSGPSSSMARARSSSSLAPERQDPRHRRARPLVARDQRRPPPRAASRPDRLRQGGPPVARADRRARAAPDRRPPEHLEFPQLPPWGAQRERSRCGHAPRPDVLDGVGQLLLLRELRAESETVYHSTTWRLPDIVKPSTGGRTSWSRRTTSTPSSPAAADLRTDGSYAMRPPPPRRRRPQARPRRAQRLRQACRDERANKDTDLEDRRRRRPRARRTIGGLAASSTATGTRRAAATIEQLADTYVTNGAALEMIGCTSASVYRRTRRS